MPVSSQMSAKAIAYISFAIILALPNCSLAVDVQVAPGDSPIRIFGKIGDDSTFVKRITLIAPSTDAKEVLFYPNELTSNSNSAVISRSQITLTNPTKIELSPKYSPSHRI